MIRIEGLTKNFNGVRALDGLSLEVEPGAVYGFLGPNGAGKTTTLRILTGLARADRGRAWILNQEIGRPGEDVRPLIGFLPEEPSFYPWMTPTEYLRDFIAPLYGIEADQAARRSREMLGTVGLSSVAKRKVGGFSRGMRQRLGLAQALLHEPKVLLLDEPISALDPGGRKDILDLIEALRGNTTTLFSTHILADVERVCDVIGIIAKGRLVVQDQRQNLLDRYTSPLVEIEASNGLDAWLNRIQGQPFIENASFSDQTARLLVTDAESAPRELLASLAQEGLLVRRFEVVRPTLEDIFLRLTNDEG